MNAIWWGKEADSSARARINGGGPDAGKPRLLEGAANRIREAIRNRIPSFTPEWTNLRAEDAGVALVRLFSEQVQPVLLRLNRLPDKALIEYLRLAGISPLPARPATAMLQFEVAAGAPQSVLVPRGFQVQAPPADDSPDPVIFETTRDLYAAPVKIERLVALDNGLFREIDQDTESAEGGFLPFGKKPLIGNAFLIGLDGNIVPGPALSLGIAVAAAPGSPPPAAAGGVAPLPVNAAPLLRWELFDGGSVQTLEVIRDETGNLINSGVVELRLPRTWRTTLLQAGDEKALRYLRLRMINGRFNEPPQLAFVQVNSVPVIAARTIRNEALQPVAGSGGRAFQLSQTPILPRSLVLEIEEGSGSTDPFLVEDTTDSQGVRLWQEVPELSGFGPDDRVYTLDPLDGIVGFGDGTNGKAVPRGFRNIRARAYQVGGGKAGAVEDDAIKTMVNSAPFVTGVTNTLPASGGADREAREETSRRGPQAIRARNRSVTTADYELMALAASGIVVERAHAVSGLHPSFPGALIPGVVCLFAVPPKRDTGPPTPDEQSLKALATYLSDHVAPAGVEVVAAAPTYHKVRVEMTMLLAVSTDVGAAVRRMLDAIDTYLDPLTGGEDGLGWPFGGPIRYAPFIRHLLGAVPEVTAIPQLNLVVDKVRQAACTDYFLPPHALIWPDSHQVVPQQVREGS